MKLKSLILGIFWCIFLFSCSTDDKQTIEVETDSEAIKLESPEGFRIANSLEDLKVRIGENKNIAVTSIAIESIEYFDSEEVSAAIVNYINDETGEVSNIAIAQGEFTSDAGQLQIIDKSSSKGTTSTTGDVEISCDGCTNCRVQAYRDGETGNYHFSCESSCCTMTVRQLPREP